MDPISTNGHLFSPEQTQLAIDKIETAAQELAGGAGQVELNTRQRLGRYALIISAKPHLEPQDLATIEASHPGLLGQAVIETADYRHRFTRRSHSYLSR